MALYPFLLNIFLDIAKQPLILILIWLFYIFIDYVWGGLANSLRVIFFPGYFLHKTTQSVVARLFGVSPRAYSVHGAGSERSKFYIQLKDPFMATILAVSPALTAIPFYLLTMMLYDASVSIYAKIVSAWLAVSIFITGFPNFGDLGFIVVSIIAHKPLLQAFLLWSVIILIISLNIFDVGLSLLITLSYIFLIILANSSIRKNEEIPVIVNED